jgi:hypothetical protein
MTYGDSPFRFNWAGTHERKAMTPRLKGRPGDWLT